MSFCQIFYCLVFTESNSIILGIVLVSCLIGFQIFFDLEQGFSCQNGLYIFLKKEVSMSCSFKKIMNFGIKLPVNAKIHLIIDEIGTFSV